MTWLITDDVKVRVLLTSQSEREEKSKHMLRQCILSSSMNWELYQVMLIIQETHTGSSTVEKSSVYNVIEQCTYLSLCINIYIDGHNERPIIFHQLFSMNTLILS